MEADVAVCLFQNSEHVNNCGGNQSSLIQITEQRLLTIIKKSKKRKDALHLSLENISSEAKNILKCHENCISTYTSDTHIARYLKKARKNNTNSETTAKRRRRSETSEFLWKENCLFCGKICTLEKDPKHPDRWREAYLCRTSDRGSKLIYKDKFLQICKERNDKWAEEVRTRLSDVRASHDLHAADARYHNDCRLKFTGTRNIKVAKNTGNKEEDNAYSKLSTLLKTDPSRMWTSVDLEDEYKDYGGTALTRKELLSNIVKDHKNDVILLSSPGIANIVVFKSHAHSILRIQEVQSDDIDDSIGIVAKTVISDIKDIHKDKEFYNSSIDIYEAKSKVSLTLSKLLSMISPMELSQDSLPSILIGNMITSRLSKQYTDLLISLAVMIRKKPTVQHLYDYGVVCSYDELVRFRTSAAAFASQQHSQGVLRHSSTGLVQAVADNFDCNISSVNGLKQTHSLALTLIQHGCTENETQSDVIPRLKRIDLKSTELKDVSVVKYYGPKRPDMPAEKAQQNIQLLKVLAMAAASSKIASEVDFQFLQDITQIELTPEYSGYNNKLTRQSGRLPQQPTTCLYTPLIDAKPTDPSTILTSLMEAVRITEETGQKYTIMTFDQQLYKILIDIKWVYPKKFKNVIARLGGMLLLMSYVGCVGKLNANTGLQEILQSTFAGVEKMLMGNKYFPQNVRALRMVVEELLRPYISQFSNSNDLNLFLDNISQQSKTSKKWVDNLIRPVLYMMMFIRAEREGDWPLHLHAVSKMIPYFFAAGHHNYARYATYYLNDMRNLPPEILKKFLNGEHTTRHQKGYWNGIWSDMFIETSFMRYGKGPGGLIGLTLRPKSVKVWAYSLHTCTRLLHDLDNIREGNKKNQEIHKEEMPARIKSDNDDCKKLRKKLEKCVNPLNVENHRKELVNVASGYINHDESVNVEEALSIGRKQLILFVEKLPEGFYDNISIEYKVKIMQSDKKGVRIGEFEVYNTEAIYARVIGLLATGQTTLESVLKHELSPVPTAMFEDTGDMRIDHSKSKLKNKLQVEVNSRSCENTNATIIDGNAIFWTFEWPKNCLLEQIAENMYTYVKELLCHQDVHLVFDLIRYKKFSPKSSTHTQRAKNHAFRHHLTLQTILPAKEVTLSCAGNKVQLIDITSEYVSKKIANDHFTHTLMITGSEDVPVQIANGDVSMKYEMTTTHEEADIIIVQQCYWLINEGCAAVKIISDDTDVFALACYFYPAERNDIKIFMEATCKGRSIIDIGESVHRHSELIPSILLAHALSGCDSIIKCTVSEN